jgi:hypothetical protein
MVITITKPKQIVLETVMEVEILERIMSVYSVVQWELFDLHNDSFILKVQR